MYELTTPSKTGIRFDYMFRDFMKFYEVADLITYPLSGRYTIRVDSDSVKDILDFIMNEERYRVLDVHIYAPQPVVDYICQRRADINYRDSVKPIDVFKELASERRLLFGKGTLYTLYGSIRHETEEMAAALDLLVQEYGGECEITEEMLEKHFLVNKLIYPRDVVNAFLWGDRWRWNKLEKCVAALGNAVVKGAVVNNLKKLLKEKNAFFQTGRCSNYIRSLDTENIMKLYTVFVCNSCGFQDVYILFKLYERGLSIYDLLQRGQQ